MVMPLAISWSLSTCISHPGMWRRVSCGVSLAIIGGGRSFLLLITPIIIIFVIIPSGALSSPGTLLFLD